MERLHDACGIVGIFARANDESIDVRRYLTLALTALQHRGQESAGMAVYCNDGKIAARAAMGKVREVFSDTGTGLPESHCGIGHVRYSTTGSSCVENAGPFVVGTEPNHYEAIAVAHNGNLVNGPALRRQNEVLAHRQVDRRGHPAECRVAPLDGPERDGVIPRFHRGGPGELDAEILTGLLEALVHPLRVDVIPVGADGRVQVP